MFRTKGQKRLRNASSDSPFNSCRTMRDIVNVVHNLNEQLEHHHGSFDPANVVSMSINHLIHFFVEQDAMHNGRNGMDFLNQFGQSIFNHAVSSLFGQEQVDEYNKCIDNRDVVSQIKKDLWKVYVEGVSRGEISVSFEAFANSKIAEITKANPILSAMAQGANNTQSIADFQKQLSDVNNVFMNNDEFEDDYYDDGEEEEPYDGYDVDDLFDEL